MRRSRSSRSTARAASGVDVYLLPAIVGGGIGDIDEVLTAGRHLARGGFPLTLYRPAERPLPASVDGPWAWPPHQRRTALRPRAARAVTVAPAWGVTAAPAGPPPLGRPGPWAREALAIERAYGPEWTVHVSLEEFARTLTTREENHERFREGGVLARAIPRRLVAAVRQGEVAAFRTAFRRFRAFDRPNVLHLFAGFRYAPAFAREFPEAVQTGPLWPVLPPQPAQPGAGGGHWVWYASPASAEAIAGEVQRGLAAVPRAPRLLVRSSRPWGRFRPGPGTEVVATPMPARAWQAACRSASVRIATGSRSLLEALALGGPFLYFNGVLGTGRRRRRHRPEKAAELLRLARESGWPEDVRGDLGRFASGRRVATVVERVARGRGGWGRPLPRLRPHGYARGYDDAGVLLLGFVRRFARGELPAARLVAEFRRGSHR